LTHPSEDERAVRDLIARGEKAWNLSDSVAFAATMAEDVDFVGVLGERYHGREIVDAGHRHIFDTIYKGSRVRYTVERVRFLKPDVAVAIMHQKITSHLPQSALASTARQRQMTPDLHDTELRSVVMATKTGGQWLIAAITNTMVASVVTGHTHP
jgi:uncharacterized protein (TIGR02246 family)